MSRRIITLPVILLAAIWTSVAIASPSHVPGMPQDVVSVRHDRLTSAEYEALAAEWREYTADHPRSAAAEVQLGRALRYAGAAAEEVRDHFARALELHPRCPEALDAAASTYLGEWEPLADGAAGCYDLGQRAVAMAPDWPDPHFTLWPLALALGRTEEADAHLAALVDKGGIPAPILDYCYNMLIGAAPDAVIITNGDNDTYGCRALQVAHGIRPDLHVLNLSLLNQPEIEESMFARFGDSPPLSKQERDLMRRQFQANFVRDHELYSTKVVKALAAKAASGDWNGSVYLALTVSSSVLDACPYPRRVEGLLWRVVTAPGSDAGKARDAGTDVIRTHELFNGPYRLDSATDRAFQWKRNSSVRKLMDNYHGVLMRLANAAADEGNVDIMRNAFRCGLEVAAFHGRDGTVSSTAEFWKNLDPDNPEVERWLTPKD